MSELQEPEEVGEGATEGEDNHSAGDSPAAVKMDEASVAPSSATPAPGVSYRERTFTAGMTQSGKSELINHQFTAMRCQRLLLDTKGEFAIPGVPIVEGDPAGLDWSQQTLHYVPGAGGRDETEELFAACYRRQHLVVAAHEGGDLCDFKPGATPPSVISYINKGQAKGLGLLGGSQRPVMVPMHMRTEATHLFMFVPRLSPDDHDALAKSIGQDPRELAAVMDDVHERLGDHSFLWFNRRTRELIECPPLPEQVRKQTIVQRRAFA